MQVFTIVIAALAVASSAIAVLRLSSAVDALRKAVAAAFAHVSGQLAKARKEMRQMQLIQEEVVAALRELTDAVDDVKAQTIAEIDRVREDLATLEATVGQSSQHDVVEAIRAASARLRATSDILKNFDPIPDSPPSPEPQPKSEPSDSGSGGADASAPASSEGTPAETPSAAEPEAEPTAEPSDQPQTPPQE